MKISCKWLKKYSGLEISPEEISQILTSCGLEVEGMEVFETIKGSLKGVVVGEVLSCAKHPSADKLSLTTVKVGGNDILNIVCGAPNVRAGQKVLVATPGTTLHIGEKQLTINKTKIRGEISEGMICAEDELGLGTSHEGIMVLDKSVPVGMTAAELFTLSSDVVLEIGLTPNRADAASYIGVARDLVASWNALQFNNPAIQTTLKMPDISSFTIDNNNLPIPVEVVDSNACPRYSGITISGIQVKESPDWLKEFLKASGIRPINNIVDVTNFVLFELGQPLHAFDVKSIKGKKVIVKTLPDGTPFTTLDGVERKLTSQNLMICNEVEGMCIGGVFGGVESGVTEKTTEIFLESAYFNPVSIRKTSKYHGLKTDASFRFERGTDPNITVYALKRAASLIREIAGGKISSQVVDVYPAPFKNTQVEVSYKHINRLIGKQIDKQIILSILNWLGIESSNHSDTCFLASIPPFKPDVYREADVIEEILRIYGYNNIEIDQPLRSSISVSEKTNRQALRNHISDYLTYNGFFEVLCNSIIKSANAESFRFLNPEKFVSILNPISRDLDVLRQSLLPGLLDTIAFNINRKTHNQKLYEFGKIYFSDPDSKANENQVAGFTEHWRLGIAITGLERPESWRKIDCAVDFFSLKAMVAKIFERLGIDNYKETSNKTQTDIFEYSLTYQVNGQSMAELGKLTEGNLKVFDIKQDVFFADIDWDLCVELVSARKSLTFSPIPRYPEVRRDLALMVDASVGFSDLEQVARSAEANLLKEVNLFDVYEGDKIEAGKKSYAVSFILRDDSKTLKDEEIEKIMKRLLEAFAKNFNAKLR